MTEDRTVSALPKDRVNAAAPDFVGRPLRCDPGGAILSTGIEG